MDFLEEISKTNCVVRLYFGDSVEPPNDYSHYISIDDSFILPGWYENDKHLRKRIEEKINEQRQNKKEVSRLSLQKRF